MKDRNKDRLKIFGTGIVVGGIVAGGGVYASAIGASSECIKWNVRNDCTRSSGFTI